MSEATSSVRSRRAESPDLRGVTTLLCDADGTLFPSEEPAYDASAIVTRAFADRYELGGDFSAEQLRRAGTGRNFRSLSADLLAAAGCEADPEELAGWIELERREVTAHLTATLAPIDEVRATVSALRRRYGLAVVTSSASARVRACLAASGLEGFFADDALFSAEDSMPQPVSKPDPAIYLHAMAELGISAQQSLAVEDSDAGTRSAVAAGIRTIGIVQFVPEAERSDRAAELKRAGALTVVGTWSELSELLLRESALG
jgi:beta-phosphoglucomutase-like phosphatase (HAD superfamily)